MEKEGDRLREKGRKDEKAEKDRPEQRKTAIKPITIIVISKSLKNRYHLLCTANLIQYGQLLSIS